MKLTTAGESHGKGLIAILEGLPAGLAEGGLGERGRLVLENRGMLELLLQSGLFPR